MKAIAVLFAALLSLSGCATVPHASAPIRNDGLANIDQPTRLGALVLTPQAVVEDSRCPVNARCVWAGRLIVRIRIDGRGWQETVNLTLGVPYRTHGTGFALVSGEPGRIAGSPPSPSASLFGFEIR